MTKKLFFLFTFFTVLTYAQHSIKGQMHPPKNYPWMLLYKLQGAKQDFIAYDSIKNGAFEITIPKNATSGVYRLIYDNQNQLFVDVIYDNEDVEFNFHPQHPNQLVQFHKSNNNKLYSDYVRAITVPQKQLDSLQVAYFTSSAPDDKNIEAAYHKNKTLLNKIQATFEAESKGQLAHHFIKASARYNANKPIKIPADYLKETQAHFFDHIDFNSTELDNSTFKHDKINEFIFYLNSAEDAKMQTKLRKEAIDRVLEKLNTNSALSKDVQESLLYGFAQQQNVVMANYILNHYLQLPKALQDTSFISDIKGQLRTAIGNIAPNILWSANGEQKSLHKLSGSPNYLVVFWSSGCSHCLKELPLLKEYVKDKPNIHVVAVGLEDERSTAIWQQEISKYPNWTHVYGKNKWKNKWANLYGVNATPSFYLLDAQKKILAKPDDVKELSAFLSK